MTLLYVCKATVDWTADELVGWRFNESLLHQSEWEKPQGQQFITRNFVAPLKITTMVVLDFHKLAEDFER